MEFKSGQTNDLCQKESPQKNISDVEFPGRRSFLGMLIGAGSLGIAAVLSAPVVRFVLHPLLSTTTETKWSDVGNVDEFASLNGPVKRTILVEQKDGWRKIVSEKAIYIIRDTHGNLHVLSPVCSHLGCLISWRESQQQFVCPCHVGIFASDGSRISGPPPRSMDELESKIENGILKVRYQYFRQLVSSKEVMA